MKTSQFNSWFLRLTLWRGVLRRFFLFVFNKNYVETSISGRQGKCRRCGACCRLVLHQCVYLAVGEDGKSACSKYQSFRMPNCKIFPVDCRDIKDRDLISDAPCGYYFE
jgi:hypothetical protein